MAEIKPTFTKLSINSIVATGGTEYWLDITNGGPDSNSPIPSGKQIWIGYVTIVSYDKSCTVEIRPNLPTKSLGNATDTQLRGFASVATGESAEIDLYVYGALLSLAPVTATSTGVEKVWARIKTVASSAADFDVLHYYEVY